MKMKRLLPLILAALFIMTLFTTACDKRNPAVVAPEPPEQPKPSQILKIERISASADTIYADHNITYSNISVFIKDGEGFAAAGKEVLFKSNIGRIIAKVSTDSSGVATTTFWDDGDVGLAKIEATVRVYGGTNGDSLVSQDTTHVDVAIIPVPEVDVLTLEMNSTTFTVDGTTPIRARAKNALGYDVPNNTLLSFVCTKGYFLSTDGSSSVGDSVVVKTSNGSGIITYCAGPNAGTGSIKVRIGNQTASRNVTILPGSPNFISLSSYLLTNGEQTWTNESAVGNSGQIFIRALITDKYNNICKSTPVKFTTDLGTFNSVSTTVSQTTGDNGYSDVHFTPGLLAGTANITASCKGDTLSQSTIFKITSSNINSISFMSQEQISLNVANTGGTESAILRVQLFDMSGNLLDHPDTVYFKIANPTPPEGANLNNQGVGPVMVVSSGGMAQVSVNAGSAAGFLTIEASVVKDDGTVISARKTNVVISAGPPKTIQPFIAQFNQPTSVGGGVWRVVCGALVKDRWGNPVNYGTSVSFRLQDNRFNCSIGAVSFVGNESADGDSTAGIAYTTLSYSGIYTFESVTIVGESGGEGGILVTGSGTVILPLKDPAMEMIALPSHLDFTDADPDTSTKTALIRVTLKDGQGNPIHGAKIYLSSDRGEFVQIPGTNIDLPNPAANIIATDWYNSLNHFDTQNQDNEGVAEGQIKIKGIECPDPDPQTGEPGTYLVSLTANLLGFNSQATTNLRLWKYATGK